MIAQSRPYFVEVTQWHKNGDHPKDDTRMVHPDKDSTTQFEPFLSEGKVIRYYRYPDGGGLRKCELCGKFMSEHGWLDNPFGQTVCPGDFVITEPGGRTYPLKPDHYHAAFETFGA